MRTLNLDPSTLQELIPAFCSSRASFFAPETLTVIPSSLLPWWGGGGGGGGGDRDDVKPSNVDD